MSKRTVYAEDLAKELELGNSKNDYFAYILDSLINGQRQQLRDLFNAMTDEDQGGFLIDFLSDEGYDKSARNICIGELISNQK